MLITGEARDLQQNDTTWSWGDRVGPINELTVCGGRDCGAAEGHATTRDNRGGAAGAPGVSELEGKVSAIIMRCRRWGDGKRTQPGGRGAAIVLCR